MSRKLVSKIQDIKGLPAKHKRVLIAWAAFANNDGTNIFASKQSVAEKAGIHRDTVYENTDDLIAVGVLVPAKSHVCKTAKCGRGDRHYTQQHGHYTVAYNIDLPLSENTTVLIEKLRGVTVVKHLNHTVVKHLNHTVVKPDATQAFNTTQSRDDSFALTSEEREVRKTVPPAIEISNYNLDREVFESPVREVASREVASREVNKSPVGKYEEPKSAPPPAADDDDDGDGDGDGMDDNVQRLMTAIQPAIMIMKDSIYEQSFRIGAEITDFLTEIGLAPHPHWLPSVVLLAWNRAHHPPGSKDTGLYIRTPEQMLNALKSGKARLLNDWLSDAGSNSCYICKKVGLKSVEEWREEARTWDECNAKVNAQRLHEQEVQRRAAEQERLRKMWDTFQFQTITKDETGAFIVLRGEGWEQRVVARKIETGEWPEPAVAAAIRLVIKRGTLINFSDFEDWVASTAEAYRALPPPAAPPPPRIDFFKNATDGLDDPCPICHKFPWHCACAGHRQETTATQ